MAVNPDDRLFAGVGNRVYRTVESTTGVDESDEAIPASFSLKQNYPNPFNPVTTIGYSLPQNGRVTLTIYNVSGQALDVLKDEYQQARKHTITWNAAYMPNGLYFCTLKANEITEARKMVLVK